MSKNPRGWSVQMQAPARIKREPSSMPPEEVPSITPPIKLEEGEIYECAASVQGALVAYSPSTPPLIEACSLQLHDREHGKQQEDLSSVSEQLRLSTYEYAALEERYRTLSTQLSDLRKLNMTYHDVIHGSYAYQDITPSNEQLRTEAGPMGLRAKALEGDAFRPYIRDAGGLQALICQDTAVRSLVQQVGGVDELKKLVMGEQMVRQRVNEVGGLHGLDHLVLQADLLRAEQREHAELKAKVDGPEGLRAKALKYDMLQQAFAAIDRTQTGLTGATLANTGPYNSNTPVQGRPVASEVTAVMNPARARLLSAAPLPRDPDRDLYEPKPLVKNSSRKTGSNDVPLGRVRAASRSVDRGKSSASNKRRHEPESEAHPAKRPRVDVGRASALVQSTLAASNIGSLPSRAIPDCPKAMVGYKIQDHASNGGRKVLQKPNVGQNFKQREEVVQHEISKRLGDQIMDVNTDGADPDRNDRSSVDSLLEPDDSFRKPQSVTKHAIVDQRTTPKLAIATRSSTQSNATALIGGYPIALWVGTSNPGKPNPAGLIKSADIPSDLTYFLVTEMKKYIISSDSKIWSSWNAMRPNPDTCVLRFVLDGHRPSGLPQERRVCRQCASANRRQRPCALLQEVNGVRTVVFMPLSDAVWGGIAWTDKRFWVCNI